MSDTDTARNAAQIAYWNSEAGPRWVAMQERMDAMLAPLMTAALDRARPAVGETVLDVGCGCGATLLALADRVGPDGSILGVDISAPMLDRARERVRDSAMRNVRLTLSDAAVHAFEPGAFDLAFSRFGVMFFDDPDRAFANIRSALAATGRWAFVCWAPPRDNPWLTVPLTVARQHLPPQPESDPSAPKAVLRVLAEFGASPPLARARRNSTRPYPNLDGGLAGRISTLAPSPGACQNRPDNSDIDAGELERCFR